MKNPYTLTERYLHEEILDELGKKKTVSTPIGNKLNFAAALLIYLLAEENAKAGGELL